MVNSVNSFNFNIAQQSKKAVTNASQKDVTTVLKYINNETVSQAADTFGSNIKSTVGSAALFEGLPLVKYLKNCKKLSGSVISDGMRTLGESNSAALQNLLKGQGKLTERIANFIKTSNSSNKIYAELKSAAKLQTKASSAAAKAAEISEKLLANPESKHLSKLAEKAAAKAETAAAKAAATSTGTTVASTAAKSAGKFGKIGKFMKNSGAGFMLAFSGIIEGVTEVIPTFKELGFQKGIKQLGKSAVKVAGDTFGFIAGQQAGVAAGTAIGTAICPGIGTAVGAVCGFVGGMLGSWAMGKVTKAVTGKSEREIEADKQTELNAKQIIKDGQSIEEIKQAALQKIEEEAANNNGQLSEDSLVAYAALQNLETTNPYSLK